MTKEELYTWYQEEINKGSQELISEGTIISCNRKAYEYKIIHGRNLDFTIQCDQDWKKFVLEILSELRSKYSESEFIDIADSLPFHDFHWRWFEKYRCLETTRFDWFYIICDNQVQGVCITSHPKESLFDKQNIFYIEYIAVAPWNRKCDFIVRKFHGLGTLLIKTVCNYFMNIHHYRCGFALSAVPQAKSFYESIGMTPFPEHDHDNLFFYEMNEENTICFLGAKK